MKTGLLTVYILVAVASLFLYGSQKAENQKLQTKIVELERDLNRSNLRNQALQQQAKREVEVSQVPPAPIQTQERDKMEAAFNSQKPTPEKKEVVVDAEFIRKRLAAPLPVSKVSQFTIEEYQTLNVSVPVTQKEYKQYLGLYYAAEKTSGKDGGAALNDALVNLEINLRKALKQKLDEMEAEPTKKSLQRVKK